VLYNFHEGMLFYNAMKVFYIIIHGSCTIDQCALKSPKANFEDSLDLHMYSIACC
jgi:hypothetical protein